MNNWDDWGDSADTPLKSALEHEREMRKYAESKLFDLFVLIDPTMAQDGRPLTWYFSIKRFIEEHKEKPPKEVCKCPKCDTLIQGMQCVCPTCGGE